MFDLKVLFNTLKLPLGMVAVIVALLAWAGAPFEQIAEIAGKLVGLQLFGAFCIDALKYAGIVDAGASGKWSAVYNLLTLAGVAVQVRFFPGFDLFAFDGKLIDLVYVLGIVFTYVTQIIGTKAVHVAAAELGYGYKF